MFLPIVGIVGSGGYWAPRGSAAQVGALYDEMGTAQGQAQSTAQTLSTQASGIAAVDLPQAATDLSLQRSTLQSALYALAQAVPPSLLQYLP